MKVRVEVKWKLELQLDALDELGRASTQSK